MPYSLENPPAKIKDMPKHCQEIFIAAFNAALIQYKGDEGKANATAYAACKKQYEQNKDGEWMAKESKGVIMELQSIYAEIIQEAGKRNAASDAGRIKKIVELCQELLSSETPDEEKAKEAIKEATATLVWLKEQEIMKTEDGVKFPKEAFAYTPNAEVPATWKLLLWESIDKKVTKAQLGRVSAALSPGGFRGQRVEIPTAESSSVKRTIRTEYRKLGVDEDDIPRWVKEAETRERIRESACEVILEEVNESDIAKGILPIRILKPGFNSGQGRFYSERAVKDSAQVFDNTKMYADHPTESDEKQRPERSIRDWVATLHDTKVSEKNNSVGKAHIHAGWLKEMVSNLYKQGNLGQLGLSINAVGKGTKQTIDNIRTLFIEAITKGKSVDFVTEAGAGGQAGLMESAKDDLVDIEVINLIMLRESRPDLIKEIESEMESKIKLEVKKKMESDEKITELEGQITTLTTERDGLKTKITESEKAQRKAEAKSVIDKAISESELPIPSKVRLVERFKDALTSEGVAEAVKSEKDYVGALAEAGKVKGLGKTTVNTEKDTEALKESFKRMHPEWSDKQLDTAVNGR